MTANSVATTGGRDAVSAKTHSKPLAALREASGQLGAGLRDLFHLFAHRIGRRQSLQQALAGEIDHHQQVDRVVPQSSCFLALRRSGLWGHVVRLLSWVFDVGAPESTEMFSSVRVHGKGRRRSESKARRGGSK